MKIKEIVIAVYDKDISWLSKLDTDVIKTIYRKGENKYDDEIILKPNVGRDVHSFFYHIYENYDSLADITFFVQDYPFDHWENVIEVINNETWENKASLIINGYYGFHFNTIKIPSPKGGIMWTLLPSKHFDSGMVLRCQPNGRPHDMNPNINVNKYWGMLFEQEALTEYEFIPGGHFGITKETIKKRSREFYKKIIDILESDIHAPWVIERLECYIFNGEFKSKL
tara:strand:+ start:16317 stop:16994 length:678 start_codon:yes stop_codon:yes gene_type:complete